MLISVILFSCVSLILIFFLRQAKFGRTPSAARLAKIKLSPNFRSGSFQNMSPTPDLTEGAGLFSVLMEFLTKKERVKPVDELPSQKTDLLNLDPREDVLIWFGHSSYFIQVDGRKILVDPVLSGTASPLAFTTRAFRGTDRYTADDLPPIDYLFISHDHWDHLDYSVMLKLRSKVHMVICGLGTGQHFGRWGYNPSEIIEKDWNEKIVLPDGFTVFTTPARHFSGRGFKRNQALWTSFVLQTPSMKIFIGGDSGYDTHFATIGKTFGPFDLVILENGQYNKSWKYIHMMPPEVLQAAKDLNAKRLFPVHSGKFALANHPWDEPLNMISELAINGPIKLLTPMIGEKVNLQDTDQQFSEWWKGVN